jgi:hypothetical protein
VVHFPGLGLVLWCLIPLDIYNYQYAISACHHTPLKLWVWIPLMVKCTRYNIMYITTAVWLDYFCYCPFLVLEYCMYMQLLLNEISQIFTCCFITQFRFTYHFDSLIWLDRLEGIIAPFDFRIFHQSQFLLNTYKELCLPDVNSYLTHKRSCAYLMPTPT